MSSSLEQKRSSRHVTQLQTVHRVGHFSIFFLILVLLLDFQGKQRLLPLLESHVALGGQVAEPRAAREVRGGEEGGRGSPVLPVGVQEGSECGKIPGFSAGERERLVGPEYGGCVQLLPSVDLHLVASLFQQN